MQDICKRQLELFSETSGRITHHGLLRRQSQPLHVGKVLSKIINGSATRYPYNFEFILLSSTRIDFFVECDEVGCKLTAGAAPIVSVSQGVNLDKIIEEAINTDTQNQHTTWYGDSPIGTKIQPHHFLSPQSLIGKMLMNLSVGVINHFKR